LALGVLAFGLGAKTAQAAPPSPMKVGQTVKFTLEANAAKDYSVALAKGVYRIVWDAERVDGEDANIQADLQLLKPNGVIIDSSLVRFNDINVTSRTGTTYRVVKPFVARFRVRNDDNPLKMWLTVVPVTQKTRVPFGWGATVTPARISSDNGVGGTLEGKAYIYHSITLPPGKWSISLGLQLPEGENSNLQGSIDRVACRGSFWREYNISSRCNSRSHKSGR
jgi:hypothetical protein